MMPSSPICCQEVPTARPWRKQARTSFSGPASTPRAPWAMRLPVLDPAEHCRALLSLAEEVAARLRDGQQAASGLALSSRGVPSYPGMVIQTRVGKNSILDQ